MKKSTTKLIGWILLVVVAVVLFWSLVLVWPGGIATGWGWAVGWPKQAAENKATRMEARARRQERETVQAVEEGPCPAKEPKAISPDGEPVPWVVGDRNGSFVCGPGGWIYQPGETKDEPEISSGGTSTETVTIIWSDADAFDATAAAYPMGDATGWTYVQCWDSKTVTSTVHVAWAPGIKVVIADFVGTRYQIWGGPDVTRWEEMRTEVQRRDGLEKPPPLYVIGDLESTPTINQLPKGWVVAPLFEAATKQ